MTIRADLHATFVIAGIQSFLTKSKTFHIHASGTPPPNGRLTIWKDRT
ncbi:hypothetical protein BH10PSE10_BH10PSE10_20520 [soil metagenome]